MKIHLLTSVVAFGVSLLLCVILIPVLRKLKAGQNILVYVKEHAKKSGTPTMGGIAFVLAALLASAIFLRFSDTTSTFTLLIGLAYMAVGLIDDFLKRRHKENLGLKAYQKFIFQLAIAVFAGIYCVRAGLTVLHVPFLHKSFDIGLWVLPLSVLTFVATVNSVNLTDGLDGLASGASVAFFISMGVVIWLQGYAPSLSVICFAIVGALLAYLIFNVSPASVFMGDTGSLALGGFAACVGVFSGNVLYIAVVGIMFVVSAASVILQVIYFKLTRGKRIFLMSPIHHHFQEKGYSESKISYVYFVVTLVIGTICVLCIL
ncbi:MAG: phospho-N-acetylmuramoyl-pentapeptide-transferase [Clostridia bacterium]|nr:phospho-N-acetylmuramoyl-pentapeptide-transferase [Clostridia bacterium]